jgi:hypothetical protein
MFWILLFDFSIVFIVYEWVHKFVYNTKSFIIEPILKCLQMVSLCNK